jgi:predicted RNA binding protein YcfA (HicA-like mRNA interferase family)
VSQRGKLIEHIRRNPQDVRFDDACKVAEWLGFTAKGAKGSHHAFARPGEPTQLNFQEQPGGKVKTYQARQLIEMIEKYEDEL